MKSVLEMFKIGYGPDTNLNLVPYRACRELYTTLGAANKYIHHIEICLYNEYARLGKEANIERDIADAFEFATYPVKVIYDKPTPPAARSPYTFDVYVYINENEVSNKHRVVSTGGGDYMITDHLKPPYYQFENFAEMQKFFNDHKISYYEFCSLFDKKKDLAAHFDKCLTLMRSKIESGLEKTGLLDLKEKGIWYERRAKTIFESKPEKEGFTEYINRMVTAYSYAIGEEGCEKSMTVFTPTASTAATFWSVVTFFNEEYKPDEERIYNGLCAAGLIGSCLSKGDTLLPSEIGCQGPMAVATAMAAAYVAVAGYEADINEVGRAAEMAIEHTLGLICDSVCAVPVVPCIQRAASYASRAYEIVVLNHALMETPELCKLDDVLKVLTDTGKDLVVKNKRLAMGGFKEHAAYSIEPPKEKVDAK